MDIANAGWLRGNLTPAPGHRLRGEVAVPGKYFTEGRTEEDALIAFLEDDNWEAAMVEGKRFSWVRFEGKVTPPTTTNNGAESTEKAGT